MDTIDIVYYNADIIFEHNPRFCVNELKGSIPFTRLRRLYMKKRFIKLTLIALIIAAMLSAFAGCMGDVDSATTQEPTAQVQETEQATQEPTEEPTAEPTEVPTEEPTAEPVSETITDVLGYEIEVPQTAPVKIVSLTPSNTEILFALGLGEYVIGVDEYSDYPAEASEIAKVGDFNGPNVEAIIALEPDLVLGGNGLQEDAIAQLNDVDIKIAAVEATTYEEIYATIELIGKLTLTDDAAQEVIAGMREKEAETVELAQGYEGEAVTAYYVMSAGEYGNWTSGPGSLINDMLEMLGVGVITDIEGGVPWMDFSLETLIAEDPDILLLSSDAYISIEDLCALDGYKELTACKEGSVYMVDASLTQRPAVRIVDGLKEIYNAIYEN
jgi:iron complex transport system substrate-binding protein